MAAPYDRLTRCHVEPSAGRFVDAVTFAMGTPERAFAIDPALKFENTDS